MKSETSSCWDMCLTISDEFIFCETDTFGDETESEHDLYLLEFSWRYRAEVEFLALIFSGTEL